MILLAGNIDGKVGGGEEPQPHIQQDAKNLTCAPSFSQWTLVMVAGKSYSVLLRHKCNVL